MSSEKYEGIASVRVGCIAKVKVGRNEIPAKVLEINPDGYRVQSTATNKVFKVKTVGRVMAPPEACTSRQTPAEVQQAFNEAIEAEMKASGEYREPLPSTPVSPETIAIATAPIHGPGIDYTADEGAPNPAPESAPAEKPVKKLSLLDAAVEVLKTSGQPMNTREIVKAATDSGLWIPTACRTPEQTLYGSIFREIATKENPRIVKAEQKGKFRLA